jgi:lambda repressor-like predicted transcriptional regulator
MDPIDIKYLLEKSGHIQSDVARIRGCSRALVCRVIHGKDTSAPTQKVIAGLIGRPVKELWPPVQKAG